LRCSFAVKESKLFLINNSCSAPAAAAPACLPCFYLYFYKNKDSEASPCLFIFICLLRQGLAR